MKTLGIWGRLGQGMGGHMSATSERVLERDRKFIRTNLLNLKLLEKGEVGQGSLSKYCYSADHFRGEMI